MTLFPLIIMKNHLLSAILILTCIIPVNAQNDVIVNRSVRNDISQKLKSLLNTEETKHGDQISMPERDTQSRLLSRSVEQKLRK